jgi:integrase
MALCSVSNRNHRSTVARLHITSLGSRGIALSIGHVASFRRRFFDRAVQEMRHEDPRFPTLTPHDLRHTAASLAVSAGANVKAVQRMLGHASAAMTLDVYADLFDDDLDAVGEALNEQAISAFVGKMWAPTPRAYC